MEKKDQYRLERLDRGIKVRTEGIYAVSSWREMSYLLVPRLVLILGLLALPLLMPSAYWQRVVSMACIYALLTLGFDLMAHYVGLVSLGGAFFMGVGGYVTAILNAYLGWPIALTIPIAAVVGGILCTVLLVPVLPLRGVYFAIATLMYPLIFMRLIEAFNVFGGTDGIVGVTPWPNPWVEQYLILGLLIIFLFGIRRLVNEDYGLVMRAIMDNDQAVKASGINIIKVKGVGVFIAAVMGCFGGAYLVHIYMWSGLSQFGLDFSIIPIAATVIGGGGTLIGPVLGTFILIPMNEILRELGSLRVVFYCVILVLIIVLKSEGIMVYAERKFHQFQHWVKV